MISLRFLFILFFFREIFNELKKGCNGLYTAETSNKRSKADFTVGNIHFLLPIFRKARPSFFRVVHTILVTKNIYSGL